MAREKNNRRRNPDSYFCIQDIFQFTASLTSFRQCILFHKVIPSCDEKRKYDFLFYSKIAFDDKRGYDNHLCEFMQMFLPFL